MKKNRWLKISLLALVGILGGCQSTSINSSGSGSSSHPLVKKITLNHDSITLTSNSAAGTIIIATVENVTGVVSWESTDETVVTVTPDQNSLAARIKGVNPGIAQVIARIDEVSATVKVTVEQGEYLEVDNLNIFMEVGATKMLSVSSHTTNITYTSSNSEVVSVNKNGLLSALKEGMAIITVVAGTKKVYVSVKVEQVGIDILEKDQVIIKYHEEKTATLTAIGKGGVDISSGIWVIEDETVATISQDGAQVTITALESGLGKTTTISFTLNDYPSVSRTVTVKDVDLSITLTASVTTLSFKVESLQLTYTITPPQDNNEVIYTTSPSDVVLISEEGVLTRNPNYTYVDDTVLVTVSVQAVKDPEAIASIFLTIENPTKGIKHITDLDSFNKVMQKGNLEAEIYLMADIDLGGRIYNGFVFPGDFGGHFYGNGHTISNFTATSLFQNIYGTVENLKVVGIMNGGQAGLLSERIMNGTVRNIIIDVTFTNKPYSAGVSLFGNASNVVIFTSNPNGLPLDQVYGFTVQAGIGTNVFIYNRNNLTNGRGGVIKTEQQIKSSDTYTSFDNAIWNIVDGQFPSLHILNIGGSSN